MDRVYWDDFYRVNNFLRPSQFASFVANELNFNSNVIEIGSGSGRDTFFLSKYYQNIISVDQSISAINKQKEYCIDNQLNNIEFICDEISSDKFLNSCKKLIKNTLPVVIYARFFLHAINEREEEYFFDFIRSVSECKKLYLALEYRNIHDIDKIKETDEHYRRYINDNEIMKQYKKANLDIIYTVSGTGFAKHKKDDAFVTRTLLENLSNG